jgi:hypothetical protein
MLSEDKMMTMYRSCKQNVEFVLDLGRRKINVNFHIHVPVSGEICDLGSYRLQLRLDKLSTVFYENEGGCEILSISLELPPKLYRRTNDVAETHQDGSRFWTEWDALIRQTDVVVDDKTLRREPTGIRKDQAIIDIGKHSVTSFRVFN